jgi:signal transduction histidine kinase
MDAMQGQVRCESQLGHGATFIVEFTHEPFAKLPE